MINILKMCDGCYRVLANNEDMYSFVIDDGNIKKLVQGHQGCVENIMSVIEQLYGNGGVQNDD